MRILAFAFLAACSTTPEPQQPQLVEPVKHMVEVPDDVRDAPGAVHVMTEHSALTAVRFVGYLDRTTDVRTSDNPACINLPTSTKYIEVYTDPGSTGVVTLSEARCEQDTCGGPDAGCD